MNTVLDNRNLAPQTRLPLLRERLRVIAEFLVVGVCTLAFVFTALNISTALLERNSAGRRDFIEYWASGQQLAHHANPYDGGAILPMELSAGFPSRTPALVMGNAPPALLLVLPLGFLGPGAGGLLWALLLLACLLVSVRIVWRMFGAPKNPLYLLGYTFGPAFACLAAGQVALFILLGLALFLYFNRFRPFLAGASLWLCALKPQLFLPFGVVLLVWVVVSKRYKVLLGAASALIFSTAIAYLLDPAAWTQYLQMMRVSRYDKIPIPCLSIVLRRTISPGSMWLQYLPAALGCIWALDYFRRHRTDWDWAQHGSLLMLVSVLVAPYTWFTDQAILLPALLQAVFVTRSRALLAALALASAVIEIGPLGGMPIFQSPFYLWTAPAWLVWYLCAMRAADPEDAYDLPRGTDRVLNVPQGSMVASPGPSA